MTKRPAHSWAGRSFFTCYPRVSLRTALRLRPGPRVALGERYRLHLRHEVLIRSARDVERKLVQDAEPAIVVPALTLEQQRVAPLVQQLRERISRRQRRWRELAGDRADVVDVQEGCRQVAEEDVRLGAEQDQLFVADDRHVGVVRRIERERVLRRDTDPLGGGYRRPASRPQE